MRIDKFLTLLALVAGSLLPAAESLAAEVPAPATPHDNLPVISTQDVDAVIAGFRAYLFSGRCLSVDLEQRQRSTGYLTPAERLAEARRLLTLLTVDGLFSDIDYKDQKPTFWTILGHAHRAELLAIVAGGPDLDRAERTAFATAADRVITAWRVGKFRSGNWWYNDFGAPLLLGTAGVLLGDTLSAENRQFLVKLALRNSNKAIYDKIGGGGNQVWMLSRDLIGALLAKDPVWTSTIANAIQLQMESPIVVAPERRASGTNAIEGLQPDATMHQHGPQMQMGNYGLSFAVDAAAWAVIWHDTPLKLSLERMAALRRYLLEGQAWVYWQGRIDVSGIGRRLNPKVLSGMYTTVSQPMADLAEFDPASAAASRAFFVRNQPGASNDLVGFRWFWRSDYGVARNAGFFASVRLHSVNTIGWETVNKENLQGQHLADGATYLSTSGGEYDEILPVWDWKRLPGITNVASPALQPQLAAPVTGALSNPAPLPVTSPIEAGGVGQGRHGCIAYQHAAKKSGLGARKSWFFQQDLMVCLGSGIVATSKDESIITSVNQCLGRGLVRASVSGVAQEVAAGAWRPLTADWIEHDGLRYEFPAGGALLAGIAQQTGTWKSISTFVIAPPEPQSLDVFSLVIDHGRLPTGGSYAYAVRPTSATAVPYRIISNTADQQAVAWDDRHCAVVFWQPGTITWASGRSIHAAAACLVDLDGDQVAVSDPTRKLTQIDLQIDGKPVPVTLRTDPGYAGSTVIIANVNR
jgi:chondroitin AC lyase